MSTVFRYESYAVDAEAGLLTCTYSLDGREFSERVTLPPGPRWASAAARAAARLVFLLAGVSYYKTAAPPVIDLGDTALSPKPSVRRPGRVSGPIPGKTAGGCLTCGQRTGKCSATRGWVRRIST